MLPTGIARFAGKLADGTPFSASNALSQDNVMPFYARVYGGAGAVSAFVTFRDLPAQSDADAANMRWFKPANPKGPNYRAGWPDGLLVEFAASKFVAPKISGTTLLGNLPGANNAIAQLTSATMPTLTNELSIATTGPVVVGGAPPTATPANQLRVTLLPTGMFLGSFIDPLNQKVTPFTGAVLQKGQNASGYFLAAPPTGSPVNTPKTSGLIEIGTQ